MAVHPGKPGTDEPGNRMPICTDRVVHGGVTRRLGEYGQVVS